MLKALVFDMDGVIIDSEPIHTKINVDILNDEGVTPNQSEFFEFTGVRDEEMWETLIKRHNMTKTVEELMDMQRVYKKQRFTGENVKPVDGITTLLSHAKKKGLRIALSTSSPLYFARYILESLEVIKFFDVLATADDVSKGKPDPEIYLKAASMLGVLPEECMAIEDASLGIQSAKGAAMKCIGFKNPNSGDQDLSLADLVVTSIKDINLDNIIQTWE